MPSHATGVFLLPRWDQQVGNLVRRVERDPALRARLVAADPIGWRTATATGSPTGGSFVSTPLCASNTDTGCVVAYRTQAVASTARRSYAYAEGDTIACINPASPGSDTQERLAGVVTLSTNARTPPGYDPKEDGLLVVRDAWQAQCVPTPDGAALQVRWSPLSGDQHPDLLELDHGRWLTPMGTHVLDVQLTLLDVIGDIRDRARVWAAASRPVSSPAPLPPHSSPDIRADHPG